MKSYASDNKTLLLYIIGQKMFAYNKNKDGNIHKSEAQQTKQSDKRPYLRFNTKFQRCIAFSIMSNRPRNQG